MQERSSGISPGDSIPTGADDLLSTDPRLPAAVPADPPILSRCFLFRKAGLANKQQSRAFWQPFIPFSFPRIEAGRAPPKRSQVLRS